MFMKLWPRMLRAAAVEAISELAKDAKFEIPSPDAILSFMSEAEAGTASEKDISPRTRMVTREARMSELLESRDQEQKGEWVHRAYLPKPGP